MLYHVYGELKIIKSMVEGKGKAVITLLHARAQQIRNTTLTYSALFYSKNFMAVNMTFIAVTRLTLDANARNPLLYTVCTAIHCTRAYNTAASALHTVSQGLASDAVD